MIIKSATRFVFEIKDELSKVVWPKWNDFVGSTIVVLVFIVISALYLGFLDFVFSRIAWIVFNRYGG